jgi:hypothetical protein
VEVRIFYHAFIKEKLGRESEFLFLSMDAPKASDALRAFVAAHPEFAPLSKSLTIAIENEILPGEFVIRRNSRIDLFPPFGGG